MSNQSHGQDGGNTRTENVVHIKLCPRNHLKLFGTPEEKSNSVPLSSIRFRQATNESISISWYLSTISEDLKSDAAMGGGRARYPTCTGDLKEVLLFKAFEDSTLDLHELIGDKKRE